MKFDSCELRNSQPTVRKGGKVKEKPTLFVSAVILIFTAVYIPGALPQTNSYTGNEIAIVKIVNQTDYTLEVIITDPMKYKGGIIPPHKSALVSIPSGNRAPSTVTIKAIALKDGHLEGDWQETFPVPQSSADFIPIRTLKPESFE